MADFTRPTGFRFAFGGVNTRSPADGLPPNKYTVAQNVRALANDSIRTRPGLTFLFKNASTDSITDLATYAALGSDDNPRILARGLGESVWLDTGALATIMAGPGAPGASMIPYRPNQSPQAWMYIANGYDYQKLSAPDALNAVIAQKVGVAEPQSPPEACPDSMNFHDFTALAASWATGGAAPPGAPGDVARSADTSGAVIADPASVAPSSSTRYSVEVATTVGYQIGELATFTIAATPYVVLVQDVLPPIAAGGTIAIGSIRYFTANGLHPGGAVPTRCVVVPSQQPVSAAASSVDEGIPSVGSVFTSDLTGTLRRGALIRFAGGTAETCLVLNAVIGPDGTISFETVTVNSHAAGEVLNGLPAIVVADTAPIAAGQVITSPAVSSAFVTGVGTLSQALGTSPFNSVLTPAGIILPQLDDYIHISLQIANPALINEIKVIFDINFGRVGGVDYVRNAFYYTIRQSDLALAPTSAATQLSIIQTAAQRQLVEDLARYTMAQKEEQYALDTGQPIDTGQVETPPTIDTASAGDQTAAGTAQWTEIMFPVRSLLANRIGDDQTCTLTNCRGVQIGVNATGNVTVLFGSLWIGGGGQCDVGSSGSPLFYRVRPRSTLTGAKGNSSAPTRYGVGPRRQRVIVSLPSSAYDSQIDTWDIFRYGGSVLSWRYAGSAPSGSATFTDSFTDDAVRAGDELETDNFEPWPTIDVPYVATAGVAGITSITVCGTCIAVVGAAAVWPATILRWLPGTLIQIAGLSAYTLWARPTVITNGYLFQIYENAGTLAAATQFIVKEPIVGNQKLPYMWGPSAEGDIFACGDPLRPGNVYFIKSFQPDSAPDKYNLELTEPSEPLLGGEIVDGFPIVASSSRWWQLRPAFGTTGRYASIRVPITRGLAAPYGHCTDGHLVFFWAKDGIWVGGLGESKSLTDDDLYNIFPHEGVLGIDVTYGGYVFYAPDYKRASTFRLEYCNSYLYADYQDSAGTQRTIVCDLNKMAWSTDVFPTDIRVHKAVRQQEGTVLTSLTAYPMLLLANTTGKVYKETDLTNDDGTPISCVVGTFEWNGGDLRANEFWGDLFLDCVPVAAVTCQPLSGGIVVPGIPPTIFVAGAVRNTSAVSMAGGQLLNYLGLGITWTDNYMVQSTPTTLYTWQPSFIPKPEIERDRATDWEDGGIPGAKFWQGLRLKADTFGQPKSIKVRDADTLAWHDLHGTLAVNVINHAIESEIAYSFDTPFVAHLVRIEPQDMVPWRQFRREWIVQPTPEQAMTWKTQFTSHGLVGYHHISRILAAYSATAPVILTLTAFDGTSPSPLTLPATGGIYQKFLLTLTPNKGLLYSYSAVSTAPFRVWLDDFEVHIGQWQRESGYLIYRNLGGTRGDRAEV